MLAWQLADLAEWIGARPSDLLNLREMGYGRADCLDVDFAVRALKRWADRREQATHQVPDHEPDRKQRMKTVPTYPSLAAVLGLEAAERPAMDAAATETAKGLAAAMASGSVDWEAFGLT